MDIRCADPQRHWVSVMRFDRSSARTAWISTTGLRPPSKSADLYTLSPRAVRSPILLRPAEVQHSRPPSKLDPYADKLSQMLRQEGEVARAEADGQTIARRSGRPRLRRLLQSRGGLRSRLEGRPAAGTEDVQPRRVRAAGVFAGRGVPVERVTGSMPVEHCIFALYELSRK
jgi:hypothetical protein